MKETKRNKRLPQFSSENDPKLGPPPFQFSLALWLLIVYTGAFAIGMFNANELKSPHWNWIVFAYAIVGGIFFGFKQSQQIKELILRFVMLFSGAFIFGYFLRYVVIFLAKRNEDMGMASAIPFLLTVGAIVPTVFGIWLQVVSLRLGTGKSLRDQSQ